MTYQDFIEEVKGLDFIKDDATADAAIKAILGTLASSMDEASARQMTENLPEPLTYEKLRSHQAHINVFTSGNFLKQIADQFNLNMDQVDRLIHTVINLANGATGLNIEEMSRARLTGL